MSPTPPPPPPPEPPTPNSPPATSTTTTTNPLPSSLPPEAIDLATQIFNLARIGNTPLLHTYLSAGIPPTLTNTSGDTLLMLAAYHGHALTVSMLLEHGADPNVLNDKGQSPIAGAVFKGWDDVIKVLWEGGADVRLGRPCAVECARMFKRGEVLGLFGVEEGEGDVGRA